MAAVEKLQQTKKYELFAVSPENRLVHAGSHLKKIIASMKQYGFLKQYPLAVCKSGKQLIIKDGHHRFAAAQKLGLPVYYIEDAVEYSIPELNNTQAAWNLRDYMDCFCSQGYEPYLKMREFVARHRLPLSVCVKLLSGQSPGNIMTEFRTGYFKVKSPEIGERVAMVVQAILPVVKWAKDAQFVDALYGCVLTGQFDEAQFIQKVKAMPAMMQKRPDIQSYRAEIEEIYNFRSRKRRVPLAFLAREVAEGRRLIKVSSSRT